MLSEVFLIVILIIIGLLLLYSHFVKKFYSGRNLYTALLLAFLIPGTGLFYIGKPLNGFLWFFIQIISVTIAFLVDYLIAVQPKYLGLIIMLPFFIQLYATGIEYKNKYGDIKFNQKF
jgi:hypothetical protein